MDITNTDIEKQNTLNKLLLNLETISLIKENDKLYCDNNTMVIDEPYFLQSFVRTYNGYNRQSCINNINKLIDDILEYLDNLNSDNNIFKEKIISDYNNINQNLLKSISGLQNLKITYFSDIKITKQIDFIIIKIQTRINKINQILK